ncbi:MAG: LysM peptidoglycan-binding domain-containing protein [Clostridia bacterium]|nr:LysM peptidoglycan-binding domain-containing protein [Clostridia bacterium]
MERTEEQNGRVQLEFTDKTQPVELTAEITLPDYRSEISRLLWVRPTFMPPTRFQGGGKADFSGPVRYNILYTGPDGALYSAESEEGYAFSVPLESLAGYDAAEGVELSPELSPDAVISRVMGPRKLSVRCRLHVRVRGYATKNLTPRTRGEGTDRDRIHRLCDAVENGRLMAGEAEHMDVSDRIDVEPGEGELRVICADGSVFLPDVAALDGAVRCRGEAVVSVLLCREAGEGESAVPFVATRRIPFEKEVTLEGITPDCDARATGTLGELRATVEDGKILLDGRVTLCAEGQTEESVLLCRDVFLPGCRAECQFGEERMWRAGLCGNRNFSISGERPLSELGLPADVTVLHSLADAEIKEKQAEGAKTALLGEMRCHVLYRREGEYGVAEMAVPFRTVIEGACDDMSVDCCVPACRVTPVRDGSVLRADAEIQLAVRMCQKNAIRMLAEATFVPAEPLSRADLEICYPAAKDTLWDVGKRYGVSPDALATANGISAEAPGSAESLAGVRYLLIP